MFQKTWVIKSSLLDSGMTEEFLMPFIQVLHTMLFSSIRERRAGYTYISQVLNVPQEVTLGSDSFIDCLLPFELLICDAFSHFSRY